MATSESSSATSPRSPGSPPKQSSLRRVVTASISLDLGGTAFSPEKPHVPRVAAHDAVQSIDT